MKIVQLLPELNEGGVERGVVELNRALVLQGYDSYVISNGGKLVEQIKLDGGHHIKFDVCSKNIFTIPIRVFKLRHLLKTISPNIIHARSRVPAWLVHFANKKLKIPFVTTVHGLNSVNSYSKIMTTGDEVICVSEVVKEYIISNYNINNEKLHIIQRGVDLNKFNCDNLDHLFINKFKLQYNLKNKYIVTSVGRITWLKDYETFIKSIAIVQKTIPNIIGLIVGGAREDKNDYLMSLIQLSKSLNIEDNIIFTGSQNNIAEIYSISDIVVNVSLKMGNIGRTVIEALALDKPVIATTYNGLINIIEENINGSIVDVKNEYQLSQKIIKLKKYVLNDIRESIPIEYTLDAMLDSTMLIYKRMDKK